MKKIVNVLVTGCLLALVGCSSNSTTPAPKAEEPSDTKENPEAAAAPTDVKVMKLSVVTSKDRSLTQGLVKFGEIVEKETNGAIKAEVYPDGQLGGDLAVFDALKIGTIQGSTMSTGPIATTVESFNVFDLPFLFKDEVTAYKVLDGPIGQELLDQLPAVGVIGLNYWENGFRHLTNNTREVKSVDDISGLKIRTLENNLHIDMWKELGATPTPIPYTELFTALEQRVVDGQENPAGNVTTAKFYEVQKYLTTTGHVYNASVFMLSKKFWDTLTDEEKEIVKKAAAEAQTYQRELNQKESVEAIDFLKKEGMVVTELSSEEKQKFVEKLQPIYKKYAPTFGEDLVNKLLEANK
ncbi:TRAP transporter substrate-binding protein [Ammoniphilus resinae]|uniref:Tripartite ATP-independent transporter DctP family solute receptor n=1 Tax=Ammoniphilus resinae TaxID=861532 RepID=A0ABS4GLC5_9BACL|nr:TRAP transporter substrate-binding protein [Ammoniphilus resinae]MBP1931073.1 tripartite ATP-independent transporter DctP family solute receptor [Ammoniphilus resinae]